MEVMLPCGKITLVDEEVWLRKSLFLYKWYFRISGSGKGYVVAYETCSGKKNSKHIRLHREVLDAPAGMSVDHISGDTLDNRKSNLRLCTNAENQANTNARGGSSKFKGVSWIAGRKKWLVAFRANGEYVYVGYFNDELEAAQAYDAAAYARLGAYAKLNRPLSVHRC